MKKSMKKAFKDFSKYTCVNWKPKSDHDQFVEIKWENTTKPCRSSVGPKMFNDVSFLTDKKTAFFVLYYSIYVHEIFVLSKKNLMLLKFNFSDSIY